MNSFRFLTSLLCTSSLVACGGSDSSTRSPETASLDTTAPIIILNGAAEITLNYGDFYDELGAIATDDTDSEITVAVTSFDSDTLGSQTITYTATDAAGNTASFTRTVLVKDLLAPVITLMGDAEVSHPLDDDYSDLNATAIDNVDGDVTVTNDSAAVVNVNEEGIYLVTYTAVDAAGNKATLTRTVIVYNPDLSFPIVEGVLPNELVTSATITVYGLSEPEDVNANSNEYSIDGGDFTAEVSTINNGQTIIVRRNAPSGFSSTRYTGIYIGEEYVSFIIKTAEEDDAPQDFSFIAQSGVDGNLDVFSNTVTISQVNTAAEINIVGGEYAIDDGDYTSEAGTISDGQTLTIKVTSSFYSLTETIATVTIGTLTTSFNVTTMTLIDSDLDGLSDVIETALYGTDPKLADSDNDGTPDNEEISNGTSPIDNDALSADLLIRDFTSSGYYEIAVPAFCYSVTVKAHGAGGGVNWSIQTGGASGGGGGYASSTLALVPEDTLQIFVGAGGVGGIDSGYAYGGALGGSNLVFGGGGGGSTEVRVNDVRLVVAGGGGGAGINNAGYGGAGGGVHGLEGGPGGEEVVASGGDDSGLDPNGQDSESPHAGAAGGGYSGGKTIHFYGTGGGGGSSFGDINMAGSGRNPGNADEAGNAGYGGVGSNNYDGNGLNSVKGADGRLALFCQVPLALNLDADADGILDTAEQNFFKTNHLLADSDADGLSDIDEIRIYYTDANNSDSDTDGLLDQAELFTHLTDPNDSDSDNDGLSDQEEIAIYLTDPLLADSDSDGLSDGAEVNTYTTEPLVADTDNDGLSDGDEVKLYLSDPNLEDTDGDGFNDNEIIIYGTSPLLADSDGDGLSDYIEINTYLTDALNPDSDGDGLSDSEEIVTYVTDPNNADSDEDGFSDGEEVVVQPVIAVDAIAIDSITYDAWGEYSYTIPDTCNAVIAKAWGAGGGLAWGITSGSGAGGGGGYAQSIIGVTASDILSLFVGQGGDDDKGSTAFGGALGGGTSGIGGGGGGSSEVRLAAQRLVVAGGGGGAGHSPYGAGGAGGGTLGLDGGKGIVISSTKFGGIGGGLSGLSPNGQDQTGGSAGAGGGGYSGGLSSTSTFSGGGGGSSYGDFTEAGDGRTPGNVSEAGLSGLGAVTTRYYDDQGIISTYGSDGKVIVACYISTESTGGHNPNDETSHP